MHKIALVGIGKIARDQHLPALAGSPHFELAATVSRHGHVDGVEAYSDLPSLLQARPDIGCVSLCTPPHVRYDDARAALEAGRHVMLEKPPGATLGEVEDLKAIAGKSGLSLFATWHSRHAPAVAAARSWLGDKHVRSAHVSWKEDVRRWHPGQDWVWNVGGLGVFDPGINALSILTAIFPGRLHLRDAELVFPSNRDTPVSAQLTFRDGGGTIVTAEFDWLKTGEQEWDIHLDTPEGRATLSGGGAALAVNGAPVRIEAEEASRGEYPSLYDRFAELVTQGRSDADLEPLRHVADAFMLGRRSAGPAFDW